MKSLTEIAHSLQGYDPAYTSVPSALAFLDQLVDPIDEVEELDLPAALDRILAGDLISPLDVPPQDNSGMDGYAFDGSVLSERSGEIELQVMGTALAGKPMGVTLGPGQCLRIMTGALLPVGIDTVIAQESVRLDTDGSRIRFSSHAVRRGDNRRLRGEDLRRGTLALRNGQRLSPPRLGLAASLGLGRLKAYRRPRVAVVSTGDEIQACGDTLREGAVYDSNRYSLIGCLRRLGCEITDLGLVRDQPAQLRQTLEGAAAHADLIISSGGVGPGQADHTRAGLSGMAEMMFCQLAMRPGRPLGVGRIQAAAGKRPALMLALPGNPVASLVSFLVLVRPALLKLMGCREAAPPLLRARSKEPLHKKPGRTEYQRGRVSVDGQGQLWVELTGDQGSGILSSVAQAHGLIVLPHESATVKPGDWVEVMMFDGHL
jgi:molybdopterin molybdotransferase